MGALNDAFNKAGLGVLSLASATAKYRARRNEEGKKRAKLNYSTAATIKKQNNELTKNQSEPPKSYFDINSVLTHEIDEQKIATKKALEQLVQEKAKATSFGKLAGVEETVKQADTPTEKEVVEAKKPVQSFGELPTVSTENSETKIPVDEDIKKLQEVKANIEKRNIPETAKVEEPTEDRLDWHNYADKFYEGIGYKAAEEKGRVTRKNLRPHQTDRRSGRLSVQKENRPVRPRSDQNHSGDHRGLSADQTGILRLPV